MIRRTLALALLATALAAQKPARFAAPELLYAGDQPMNAVEKMPYPSPVIFDIDGDGKREFILGDLWGRFWIHEEESSEGGIRWSRSQTLKRNGEVLKVPNW